MDKIIHTVFSYQEKSLKVLAITMAFICFKQTNNLSEANKTKQSKTLI